MPELEAIAYVSNAARGVNEETLEQLLAFAREKNQKLGITGALLFDRDLFFQYFEGPPESVAEVYASIRRSVLHSGLYLMMREPVAERAFPSWSMGFTHAPKSTLLQLADADWKSTLEAHSASEPSMGLKMLVNFCRAAREERRS